MSTIKVPFSIVPLIIHQGINDREIVLIGHDFVHDIIKIYTLSPSNSKRWIKWKINSLPKMKHMITSAIDATNNTLYIIYTQKNPQWSRTSKSKLLIINTTTLSHTTYSTKIYDMAIDKLTTALTINGKLNIFNGYNNKHYIWNNIQHKFIEQTHINPLPLPRTYCSERHTIMYIPKIDTLFIFGSNGMTAKENHVIYYRKMTETVWKCKKKVENKCPVYDTSFVATDDGKYIIMAHGDFGGDTVKAYYINTKTMKVMEGSKEISLRARASTCYRDSVIARHKCSDQVTINGFVRILWREDGFKEKRYPPQYLLQLIGKYYQNEMFYQIQCNKTILCINTDDILR